VPLARKRDSDGGRNSSRLAAAAQNEADDIDDRRYRGEEFHHLLGKSRGRKLSGGVDAAPVQVAIEFLGDLLVLEAP
jgi:hypothetical protein